MRTIILIISILLSISSNSQTKEQLQNTPSVIDTEPQVMWQYIESLGFTEEKKISEDLSGDVHLRFYTATNPKDHSRVKMTTHISNKYTGESVWHVVYTWDKKKYMPKDLEKIDQEIVKYGYSTFDVTKGRYRKHYLVSIMGNPMQKHIGSFRSNSFNIVVNGTTYTGYY